MKLKLLFLSLLICTAGFSQDFIMKKRLADGYFNNYDFYKAILMYEQLVNSYPQNEELYGKLATSYDHINDSRNAERCYAFLVRKKGANPEYLLNYARALSRNGKYDQAITWYKNYQELLPGDTRGASFSEAYQHMENFYKDSASWHIKKCLFSSPADEFSPAYFGKAIVFSSNRGEFSMVRTQYNWTQSPYLDLYVANPDAREAKPFAKELNTIYHEGPVTFNRNQDTIIFTRSNYFHSHLRKSNEGVSKLGLFQANWDARQQKWVNIHPLSLNNDEYSVEHPALSPDGNSLYFASDMPGGMGGMDLYVSHRIAGEQGESSWGGPVNLGPGINSPGHDLFPFIDGQGNLWYASNGVPGLGGLDIFFAGKSAEGFSRPVNPGYPMNTRFDDFGYITKNAGEEGYFSSDRYNPLGDDDIYSIKRPFRQLVIRVYDSKSRQPLSAKINLLEEGAEIKELANETTGSMVTVNPYKSYQFEAKKQKYKAANVALTVEELRSIDTLRIPLIKEAAAFGLSGRIFAADDRTPDGNTKIILINKSSSSKVEVVSDRNGVFTGNLLPESDYLIQASPESRCKTESLAISTKGIQRDSTFYVSIPVYCAGDIIRLGDIYYDLNKFNIRPDAAKVLDKLLKLLNEYPKMKIELRSHTDSRGTVASNNVLSENRARSAAEYLYSKGIARNRIVSKGYGESLLLNKCAKGVQCSEEEHQLNRRTEFKILTLE